MKRFSKYLNEIKEREKIGLSPKPIDSGELLKEIITNILDKMVSKPNHIISY